VPLAGVLLQMAAGGLAAVKVNKSGSWCVQVAWHQQRISGCRTLLVRGEGHLSLLLGSDQIFAAAIELLEDGGG
jgi:hypothetical protein